MVCYIFRIAKGLVTTAVISLLVLAGFCFPALGETNPTVFNVEKDLWAWNSGKYIVLNWKPYNTARYDVYRFSSTDGKWEKLNAQELKKAQYIDIPKNLSENKVLEYFVEALATNDTLLHKFSPVAVPNAVGEGILGEQIGKWSGLTGRNNIISDADFRNYQSMTLTEIQAFLEGIPSFLATYNTQDFNGIIRSAANIIYNASQNYKINPQVIITTLQKEQSLVTMPPCSNPDIQYRYALDWAMGYALGNSTWKGFGKQVDVGTWQFDYNYRTIETTGSKNGWGVGISKKTEDNVIITPENIATACLYAYTPYAGAGWGGSYGGNYLFWDIWYNVFQFQTQPPSPPALVSPGSSSEPGPVIDTLTPTLRWNEVSNADYYALAISKYPYGSGNIVYNPQQLYGTSHTVPSGVLEYGKKYRWNMQAHNSAGWSGISDTLYFQTPIISAWIDSYSPNDPNNPVQVQVGNSTPISVTFTNTGNAAWSFIAGASVWDANGNIVGDYSRTIYVGVGQQTTVSWSHTVNNPGDYWLQFGIWKDSQTLLDKKPSPSQRLIKGMVQPIISGYVRTSGGTGIEGVTMNGLPGNPSTNSSGYYSATASYGWSGTVTPAKSGYTFSPTSRSYSNVTSNQSDQNYTGTPIQPFETVSRPGTPVGETNPIAGVSYTYTTSGASSNLGHMVEYSFNWGDGMTSSWSTSTSASHSWSTTGSMNITVTARCQAHPDKTSTSDPLTVTVVPSTQVEVKPEIPLSFSVSQNYPNPFNPVTTIQYTLPKPANVRLEIFNLYGEHVRTLVAENQSTGYYTVYWDGNDERGRAVGSGVYIYSLQAGEFVAKRKMILVR